MSEEEIKTLLRENIEINKKALGILQKMNRARIIGNILWALKWMLIVGFSFGAYLYVKPFVEKYLGMVETISSGAVKINDIGGKINSDIPADLLKNIQNLLLKN